MNREPRGRKAILNVTPSEISPAAESIANNVDLLTEILLRLPATHTIRFKIVSKHCLSLLSDSNFAADHSIRNPRPSISAFYFNSEGTPVPVSLHGGRLSTPSLSSFLDGIGKPSRTTVVCSCNGLLLCCDSHFPVSCYGKGRQYIICNPTTKQYTILPISHPFESYNRRLYEVASWQAYLAFDPSRSPHYKVLLFRHVLRLPFELDVYCSQRKCWNKVFPKQRYRGGGVYWNGAFHLLIHDNGLWRFDLDTEEMTSCLRYSVGLQILEMDKDYRGWMVKCRVDLRPLILENPEIKSESKWEVKVLFIVKEEKENAFTLVLAIPKKIVSYNIKRKTWNVLHDLEHNGYVSAFPFIESLSPI
ncbi:hypothetical protein RHSIM_Rhsim13G0017400 [Rhododendron simsii]|uniref:F-box protein n=1 Tax=Rhododendron simsii TaxID=118357 RepID=A0A834FX45_RHOSS|nr:hypothetical protein RHSIM_Rhsim13G0017400 [Rhododendron simsii]